MAKQKFGLRTHPMFSYVHSSSFAAASSLGMICFFRDRTCGKLSSFSHELTGREVPFGVGFPASFCDNLDNPGLYPQALGKTTKPLLSTLTLQAFLGTGRPSTVEGCEILHQLLYPIIYQSLIYRVATIRGDAGFLANIFDV